jgi:hypothetical protein
VSGDADGACAWHPGVPAAFTCPRCGAFGCGDCAMRTRPDARAICPDCWERRGAVVARNDEKRQMALANTALGLGILALVPFVWPAGVGAILVSSLALSRLDEGHPGRARAVVGLVLGPVGLLVSVLSFVYILPR